MAPRYEDPGNVDLEEFGAFGENVFEPSKCVSADDLMLPFDAEERRRALRGRSGEKPCEPEEGIAVRLEKAKALHEKAGAELESAREEAAQIVADAEERAAEIVRQAQRDSETVEARGYQAGFEQGEEAGRRLGDQKIETIVRSLGAMVESFTTHQRDLLVAGQEQMVKLASALALKLIQRELRQDPTVVLDVVREALARVQDAMNLTIHVSPSDFQFIEGHLEEFRRLTEGDAEIVLEPDPEVDRGGCRVKSDCGEVDATLRTMVRAFLDELTDDPFADESEAPS